MNNWYWSPFNEAWYSQEEFDELKKLGVGGTHLFSRRDVKEYIGELEDQIERTQNYLNNTKLRLKYVLEYK